MSYWASISASRRRIPPFPCCWPSRVWRKSSIAQTDSGAARFIAQVSLYSQSLGVAIAQTTYATDASGEIQALRQLLETVELEGVLVQADALHSNRPFSSTSPSVEPTS